jgi:hypothetical protein
MDGAFGLSEPHAAAVTAKPIRKSSLDFIYRSQMH